MVEPLWGKLWLLLTILNVHVPCDLGVFTQEKGKHRFPMCKPWSCTRIFLAALLVMVSNGEEPRFLLTGKRIHSGVSWCVDTREYYAMTE